jgi:peptidoglycan/LPS O-acetylase OafA/YrhL
LRPSSPLLKKTAIMTGVAAGPERGTARTPAGSLEHRPQLDALRSFAVFAVLITHFWQPDPFPWIFRQVDLGFLGVRLFFVLSGFLITRILLECRDRAERDGLSRLFCIRQFYARRFLRIFPLYYGIIAAALLVNVAPARDAWPWLLTYTSNFYTVLHQQNMGPLGHFWTLAVEEQFYLVWPWLVIWAPKRWLPAILIVAVGVAPLFRDMVFGLPGEGWGTLPLGSLDTLGVGAILATALHRAPSPDVVYRVLKRVILPAGLIGYVAVHAIASGGDAQRLLVAGHEIAYAMVCCWLIASADREVTGVTGRVLSLSPLVYTGRISYGIYAYHMLMPWVLIRLFGEAGLVFPAPGPERFALATAVTLVVAAVSWHAFEQPINRLKRHFPYATIPVPLMPRQEERAGADLADVRAART